MPAYLSGSVDQELLLCHESLVAEARILKNQFTGRESFRRGAKSLERGQPHPVSSARGSDRQGVSQRGQIYTVDN